MTTNEISGDYDIDDTAIDTRPAGEVEAFGGDTDDGTLDVFRAPALAARPLSVAREMLHDHVAMMRDAFTLADGVCYTSAVPDRYRNKPKDGAAAILFGAPMGMDPMTSLQKVIAVHGTPGLEARSMKGLLKSKGYSFRVTERTATRFRIEAWEPGSDKRVDPFDEVSEWTIERAQLAEFCPTIDEATGKYREFTKKQGGSAVVGNMKYITQPTEMLEAKGTAEVCRAIAPDVLMGMPYTVEELQTQQFDDDDDNRAVAPVKREPDASRGVGALREKAARARKPRAPKVAGSAPEPVDAEEVALSDATVADVAPETSVPVEPEPPRGTPHPATAPVPQRYTPDPNPPAQVDVEAAIDSGAVPVVVADPPPSPAPTAAPVITEVAGTTGEDLPGPGVPSGTPAAADAADMEMTDAVRTKGVDMLVALLLNAGVADEDRWLAVSEVLVGRDEATPYREVKAAADLSNRELKFVVDTLRDWKTRGVLTARINEAADTNAVRDADGNLPPSS